MYQVIARKYRPRTFDEVVNQEHIKQTLLNAIDQGRVAHGYIFSGQRGTGKTTLARILAKALNCEKGPTTTPCLECSSCTEISAGNSMDLTEIDAASNRRIDDIRELRENVRYRPVRDQYKVFIIDEAHQITSDAFNALLKTLEEPPEWVVFILCTTEPHEIPPTIVSRCQSFPFHAVEFDQVVKRMEWICGQEQIEAEADALVTIALAGDGSIRDSLSALDQAIACFGKKLAAGPVRELLGVVPGEVTEAILSALRNSEPKTMLDIVERLASEGRHLQHFCGELARSFRNLLVMKVSGADTRLVKLSSDDRKRLSSFLEHFSQEDLTRYLNLLLVLYADLQRASQPRFRLEVGLLKLVYAGHLRPIEEILAEHGQGSGSPPAPPSRTGAPGGPAQSSESSTMRSAPLPSGASSAVGSVAVAEPALSASPNSPPAVSAAEPQQTSPPRAEANGAETNGADAQPRQNGGAAASPELRIRLVALLRNEGDDFTADAIEHARLNEFDDLGESKNEIEIRPLAADRATLQLNLGEVERALAGLVGRKLRVKLGGDLEPAERVAADPASSGAAAAGNRRDGPSSADSEILKRVLADPDVEEFRKRFEGEIRNARNLREH